MFLKFLKKFLTRKNKKNESEFKICEECNNQPNIFNRWCKKCNSKRFKRNFKNWSSGNNNINKFIQQTQLLANSHQEVLEWIPYNKFYDINYITKGGFGNVYKANWIDGPIEYWDHKNKNWKRFEQNMVALKSLNNSKNVTSEFINEITSHHKINNFYIIKFYGITQDPKTKNYMMVLQYAEDGNLRNYLNKNISSYTNWRDKISDLRHIAYGINAIHEKNLIHRNLHIGNILHSFHHSFITGMRLCKPENYYDNNNTKKNTTTIYGVLPYVAPEILRDQNYTKYSDIYSFGIIMYEIISGLPPYYNVNHDINLAIKICQGFRPRFNIKVPQLMVNLIKRCLDANPLNRPTAKELQEILKIWNNELGEKQTKLQKQIEEADEINKNLKNNNLSSSSPLTGLSYETHSETIYITNTSRILNFNKLPEPKNSDDYYHEQNDNIISKKFSEIKYSKKKLSIVIQKKYN